MTSNNLIPATKARNNFFDLLNRVIYGREVVYISKAGSNKLVKLEKVLNSKRVLGKLAGSLSKKDAQLMKSAIYKARTYPKRKLASFD